MIVAGIGSRKGVSVAQVIVAVEAALDTHGLAVGALSALATTAFKREEEAIFAAGRELGLPVVVVEGEALLLDAAPPPLTCLPASSPRILRQAQDGEGRLHQGFSQSPALQDHHGSQRQTSSPGAIAGDSSETLTTPSPLRGGIEGGGMKTAFLSDLPQKEGGSEAIGVVSTPTLYPSPQGGGGRQRRTSSICNSPVLKGEGGIDAASYDPCDSRAPGRKNEGTSTLTHSELSQALAGVPSVSEAAALAAAGAGARLLGPRIVVGPVTCALAISGDAA